MFEIVPETGAITISKGDTASFEVEAEREDGEPWTDDDRATFCLRTPQGELVLRRIYALTHEEGDDLEDGVIRVELHNADTDSLAAGTYSWEMRFAINPYYDTQGNIVDGDGIDTPGVDGEGNAMPFTIKDIQYPI